MSDEIEIIRSELRHNVNRCLDDLSADTPESIIAALTEAGYAIVRSDALRTRPQAPPDSPIPDKATDAAKNAQGAPAATGGDYSVWYQDTALSLIEQIKSALDLPGDGNARWNLEGAIADARYGKVDQATIGTMVRVSGQIGHVEKIVEAAAQTIEARRGETEGLDAQRESVTAEPMRQSLQRDTASEAGW